ncbi:MAG: hypothetical protein ACRCUJ_14525 [Phocaeicola sp.]
MINVEQMLNIGRDCGLNTVYEAWSQVQGHWDAFFEYDKFAEQQNVFNCEMFEKGLLELATEGSGKYKWPEADETIVDAMTRLGMKYIEPDWDKLADESRLAEGNLMGMCGCPCDDSVFDSTQEGDGVL